MFDFRKVGETVVGIPGSVGPKLIAFALELGKTLLLLFIVAAPLFVVPYVFHQLFGIVGGLLAWASMIVLTIAYIRKCALNQTNEPGAKARHGNTDRGGDQGT